MKYKVYVPEVHYQVVCVVADNETAAITAAQEQISKEDSLELEYSHTIEDLDQWKVEGEI